MTTSALMPGFEASKAEVRPLTGIRLAEAGNEAQPLFIMRRLPRSKAVASF